MRKLQSQGVHHITLNGANRQTSIDFWEGVLGMPFVFEQPNLDKASESHLYFDPGDGRLISVFTDEGRKPDPRRTPTEPGCVHHIAFSVSRVTFLQAVARLDERKIKHSRMASPMPMCCSRPTTSGWRAAITTSRRCISPMPSRSSWRAETPRCRPTGRRRIHTERACEHNNGRKQWLQSNYTC